MDKATMTVREAASLLNIDVQSVRVLLQKGLVSWGTAYKLPNSSHYSYLIYRNKLYDELGLNKGIDERLSVNILDDKIEQLQNRLDNLDKGSKEYSNALMELRNYERQRAKEIWGDDV